MPEFSCTCILSSKLTFDDSLRRENNSITFNINFYYAPLVTLLNIEDIREYKLLSTWMKEKSQGKEKHDEKFHFHVI